MYYKGKKALLKKHLSLMDLLFFGLANIIGPQIFIMLAGLIQIADIYGIFSIIAIALTCISIAMIYLELAMSMPITGLVVNAVNDAMGGFASFLVGWSQLFSNIAVAAVAALGFGIFLGINIEGQVISPVLIAIVLVTGIAMLQIFGITDMSSVHKIVVFMIMIFFLLSIGGNISNLADAKFPAFTIDGSALKKIFLGIGFFFLAFTGFEDTTSYVEEVRDGKKLPLVIFITILIVASLFIVVYMLLLGFIGSHNAQVIENPLVFIGRHIFGNYAGIIVNGIGAAASLAMLFAVLNTSSRNILSLSEKGFLPKQLYTSNEGGMPTFAVILSSLFTVIIIISGTLEMTIYLANFLYFLIVILLAISVMRLRKKGKSLERPFKIPLGDLLPKATICVMIVLMMFLNLKSLAFGLIFLFFGFILYMLRVVGEYRLKLAVVGGNAIISIIGVLVLITIGEVLPVIFDLIRPIIILCLLFFLIFSFLLIMELLSPHSFTDKKYPSKQLHNTNYGRQ